MLLESQLEPGKILCYKVQNPYIKETTNKPITCNTAGFQLSDSKEIKNQKIKEVMY